MEQIIVKHRDNTRLLLNSRANISCIKKAEQKVGLLSDDLTEITVESATPLNFELGDTIDVFGKTYTLNLLPTIKKTGARKFSYDLTFEGPQYELLDVQFLLPDDTSGDSFTGNLKDFLEVLLHNIGRIFPGKWTLGEYPADTEYKTLSYVGENCLLVLQNLCKEHNIEFEIEQNNGVKTLHIRKAGVNFPYTFRHGKTGGLYELTRKKINSKNVVTRLYVYGSSNNLGSKYRYSKLCLPGKTKNKSYIENAAAIAAFGIKENTKTFDKIFPNRYGKVTDKGAKYYAFVDSTMNFDLNEKDSEGTKWLIKGVNAKVKFTTGNLAGYEFDVHKYNHETKTIELVPFTDENGMKFPSETSAAFQFQAGDVYFFTDINLPDSYKTDAEAQLLTEATEYYNQNCQPQAEYDLNIDQNFIKQFAGKLTVVNLLAVGDYIRVEDTDIGVNKAIRINSFTRDLLKPYKYSLVLGDSVTQSTYIRIISDLKGIDKVIEINDLADPAKARRNWKASQEVLAMVFDPEGDYYTEKIKPGSIETLALSVGAKSMQFMLQNTLIEANYQGNKNSVKVTGGVLTHYTISENIRNWNLATATTTLSEDSTAYYIYAKCQKAGSSGSVIFSTTQITVDSDPNYYHFWAGVVNSVVDEVRAVSLTYGATTINGKFISTGQIKSSDGSCFIDLDGNGFHLGDNTSSLVWNKNKDGKLKLKGTLIQSPSGDEGVLGVFRGSYSDLLVYYSGDEVTYNGSMYRCIQDCQTAGIMPENTTYWQLIAQKGANGDKGDQGDNGKIGPVLVYRGIYSSDTSYYGTEKRVDAVKYNNVYYRAKTELNGSFSNKAPADNSAYWENFGAQFESIATNLLLAENANVAGWVFRNNRLESENGSVYLDGTNGKARLSGTIQYSTGYSGKISDANLFFLPATNTSKYMNMGNGKADIGKVCRLYNNSEIGSGGVYYIRLASFGIKGYLNEVFEYITAVLKPQEILEVSCFELPPNSFNSYPICARWAITGRFGVDNWINPPSDDTPIGRFPRMLAMGHLSGTDKNATVSGYYFDGRSLDTVFAPSRVAEGHYRIYFPTGLLGEEYTVMAVGSGTIYGGSSPVYASVQLKTQGYFDVYIGDDSSRNDGSFDFMVLSPYWHYPMHE